MKLTTKSAMMAILGAMLGCGSRVLPAGIVTDRDAGELVDAAAATSSVDGSAAFDGADEGGMQGTGADADSGCAATGGTEIVFQDEANAQVYLAGRWILCSGPRLPFATEQTDQAGLELSSSMSWYALHLVEDTLGHPVEQAQVSSR